MNEFNATQMLARAVELLEIFADEPPCAYDASDNCTVHDGNYLRSCPFEAAQTLIAEYHDR